jgi:hypothetical protein
MYKGKNKTIYIYVCTVEVVYSDVAYNDKSHITTDF